MGFQLYPSNFYYCKKKGRGDRNCCCCCSADGGIVEGSWILKLAAGVVMTDDTNSEETKTDSIDRLHRRTADTCTVR